MLAMGFLLGIPLSYIATTLFKNENGLIFGIKEVLAYLYVSYIRRGKRPRLDFYDYKNYTEDLVKNAIFLPNKEFDLEYRKPLSKLRKETEGVLFYGGNSSGSRLLVQVTRNSDGLASIWLHLKLDTGEEYVLPNEEFLVEPKTGPESFVGGGLRLKCLIPMRRWRISYNGLLKKKTNDDVEKKTVHVKFGFIWIASSSPQDISSDIHTKTWAKYLAQETNWSEKISEMEKTYDRWIQGGNLIGQVQVKQDNIDDREVFLWGARKKSRDLIEISKRALTKEVFCYFKTGEFLHFGKIKLPSANGYIDYGFIIKSTSLGGATSKTSVTTDAEGNQIIYVTRGPFTRKCVIKKPSESFKLNNGDPLATVTTVSLVDSMIDDDQVGYGVVLENKKEIGSPLSLPKIQLPPLIKPTKVQLVLPLSSRDSRFSEISGGKGSSLAELSILAKELGTNSKFTVPKGVVVTTAAYAMQLKDNHLSDIIEPLEVISRAKPDLLRDSCQMAVSGIERRPLSQAITNSIIDSLHQMFGNDIETISFAVRSSASGEDSEELSAAGQMTTFLGVKGPKQIFQAVVKCWASQFSFVAVQYKRQNGQVLNSPMAVVIQEMIPADVAGVMFTCDPVTGNPKQITISANYGIGESVVSASAEPDSLILERNESGLTGVSKVEIGKKNIQIVLSGDGGVEEELLSEELAKKSSLPLENASTLAEIGILVEKTYGLPVDVEWGFHKNSLYLLQARPITTFDKESELELSHELNSPMRAEEEYISMANVGEVLPGATAALGSILCHKYIDVIMRKKYTPRGKNLVYASPYFERGMIRLQNRTVLNALDGLLRFYYGEKNLITESQMVSIAGRIMDDEDMLKAAARRNKYYAPNSTIEQLFYILKDIVLCNSAISTAIKTLWNSKFDLANCKTSREFHHQIWKELLNDGEGFKVHLEASISSSLINTFLLSILKAGNKGWGPNVYKDFAYVLSSCSDVESGDVPNAMDKLSRTIGMCTDAKLFKELQTEEAHNWLQTTGSKAGIEFKNFLETHGHRGYKELDIHSKTWKDNPLDLVKNLQNMACTVGEKQSEKRKISAYETMKNLSVPLNWKQRLLILPTIPLCRLAVGWRESTKSLIVKIYDKARKAYNKLAELMVKEGRIPDADLLFHLTPQEIEILLETRSPTLIQKAIRRRAYLPSWNKIVFPELFRGYPKPINFEHRVTPEGALKLKGTPVSTGIAEGFARVATTLDEASHIQRGEILIAYSTDIGWSPYFPLLAGVVTELGGLVSHGAVVAREYGLPCVVAVQGVTQVFKTGDKVVLDGNKGTLERIDE